MTTPVTATVVNSRAANNPTGLPVFYLEALREAHRYAVVGGVSLVGGKEMGLGSKISARDATLVPEESAALDAKANEFLGQFGLNRQQVVDLLVNQFGVTQEELAYAWDVPAYPVMREGVLQPADAPEFFIGNPLDPDSSPYTGGAYRPNNWFTYRQGREMTEQYQNQQGGWSVRPMEVPEYEAPKPAGRYLGNHPNAPSREQPFSNAFLRSGGHSYEQIYDPVPNRGLEWGIEIGAGSLLGPTGQRVGGHAVSRLLRLMAKGNDVLPASLVAKFGKWGDFFDPHFNNAAKAPELRVLEGGGEGGSPPPYNWADETDGLGGPDMHGGDPPWISSNLQRRLDEEGEQLFAAIPEADRETIQQLDDELVSEIALMLDDLRPPEEIIARWHEYDALRRELYTPEYIEWLDRPRRNWSQGSDDSSWRESLVDESELTDDELAEVIDLHAAVADEDMLPDGPTTSPGGPPEDVLDLEELTGAHLSTIPEDMLPEGYSQASGGPGVWLHDENHMEPLFPEDLDEQILDFLGVTHIGGVARRDMAYEGMTLKDIADLQNKPVRDVTPADIDEALNAGVISEGAAQDLQHQLTYPAGQLEGVDPLQQGLFDQVDDVRNQLSGLRSERLSYPPGTFKDRVRSVMDDFDPMEQLQPFGPEYRDIDIRVGDIEFTFQHYGDTQPGAVTVSWQNVGEDLLEQGQRHATPGFREAMRELDKVVDRLVANGVRVEASVEAAQAKLVNTYRSRGFTVLSTNHEGESHIVPSISRTDPDAYIKAGYGYGEMFDVYIDPAQRFIESARRGRMQMALGRELPGEEGWAGNHWAMGKINQYSDDDIAHAYLFDALYEYKPSAMEAPFFESVPGRNPYAHTTNIIEMEGDIPEDVIQAAYTKFREDRAATGYGYTKPDGTVAPIEGMEDNWQYFTTTVGKAAPELNNAIRTFGGAGGMRPYVQVHPGDVRISDILRVKNTDGHVRDIIIVEMPEGRMQPFYRRTGTGNRLGDADLINTGGGGGEGNWVPFDGLGAYGMDRHWFRKTRFDNQWEFAGYSDAGEAVGGWVPMEPDHALYRYGTDELKAAGEALDQYMAMREGTLMPVDDYGPQVRVYELEEVTPNDARAGDEGYTTPAALNELLGVHQMDEYSRLLASPEAGDMTPMRFDAPPDTIWDALDGEGIAGTADPEAPGPGSGAYSLGGLGLLGAADYLAPFFSQETTLEESLSGAPQPQPVHGMLALHAENNDGWWSWIRDYPEHLEWMAKATAVTMGALERAGRSTNNEVLDGLGDGFREQAHQLNTQLGEGAVPLVGGGDPELLKGVSRDLSQNGHNGHEIFSNDMRREIENGDAMIVGYRSDADYQNALAAAGRYGVVIDGNYWRRPSDNSLKPREGEEWTREHLQKMATSGYFGGAR